VLIAMVAEPEIAYKSMGERLGVLHEGDTLLPILEVVAGVLLGIRESGEASGDRGRE
jgi:hypothetical protein